MYQVFDKCPFLGWMWRRFWWPGKEEKGWRRNQHHQSEKLHLSHLREGLQGRRGARQGRLWHRLFRGARARHEAGRHQARRQGQGHRVVDAVRLQSAVGAKAAPHRPTRPGGHMPPRLLQAPRLLHLCARAPRTQQGPLRLHPRTARAPRRGRKALLPASCRDRARLPRTRDRAQRHQGREPPRRHEDRRAGAFLKDGPYIEYDGESLSIYLSIYLSVYIYTHIYLLPFLSKYLSFLSLKPSVCWSIYLSV